MPEFHFFASSAAHWLTTAPGRDLRELLRVMDRDGYRYTLWLVPLPYDAAYEIKSYRPDVPGASWAGVYEPAAQAKRLRRA